MPLLDACTSLNTWECTSGSYHLATIAPAIKQLEVVSKALAQRQRGGGGSAVVTSALPLPAAIPPRPNFIFGSSRHFLGLFYASIAKLLIKITGALQGASGRAFVEAREHPRTHRGRPHGVNREREGNSGVWGCFAPIDGLVPSLSLKERTSFASVGSERCGKPALPLLRGVRRKEGASGPASQEHRRFFRSGKGVQEGTSRGTGTAGGRIQRTER